MANELRIVLRNCGKINPLKIEDYIDGGGYLGLEKAIAMSPKEVIAEVKKSGLRGRGGASFNTGVKWDAAYQAAADQKYVICNADEGEPGTYKDRIIMENDPQSLLEGMAICAYAIGATKGFIYCRGEYKQVAQTLRQAITQAKQKGFLSNFDLEIRMGAGAYVCGEETALIESIEGNRGEPRFKPPYPTVEGVWGQPTVVNNVETFANLPAILVSGADWFKGIGAGNYPGTKVVTLSGDVINKTFFEVPTNTSIRDIIYGLGGGILGNKGCKAVQIGGTSGGFIPEYFLDTLIDVESLSTIGASLGSGAVFVIDETRDMVDIAATISKFFRHESCGKCTPCREGTMRANELLNNINQGRGLVKDLVLLKELGSHMSGSCLCGLGQTAPTPILTAMKHFENDFAAKLN